MNIISYDQSVIEEKAIGFKDVDLGVTAATVYMKLPERLVYGLLRNYGRLSRIDARIVIEEATE